MTIPQDQETAYAAQHGTSKVNDALSNLFQRARGGILRHLGGETPRDNPGPGDRFEELKPMALPD